MNGYAATSRVLIEEGGAKVNAVNKISQTPLLYACGEKHVKMGRLCLKPIKCQ
jgi:ankyrin repeat protein